MTIAPCYAGQKEKNAKQRGHIVDLQCIFEATLEIEAKFADKSHWYKKKLTSQIEIEDPSRLETLKFRNIIGDTVGTVGSRKVV